MQIIVKKQTNKGFNKYSPVFYNGRNKPGKSNFASFPATEEREAIRIICPDITPQTQTVREHGDFAAPDKNKISVCFFTDFSQNKMTSISLQTNAGREIKFNRSIVFFTVLPLVLKISQQATMTLIPDSPVCVKSMFNFFRVNRDVMVWAKISRAYNP